MSLVSGLEAKKGKKLSQRNISENNAVKFGSPDDYK